MKIARLRIKLLTQNQKFLKKYVIVLYICKKIFENMPYKCPILLILDLPKNAGTQTKCTSRLFLNTNFVYIEEIFT